MLSWWLREEPRVIEAVPTKSGMLLVQETREYRELVEISRNTTVHTRVVRDDPMRSAFAYTDALHVAVALAPAAQRQLNVLCIGAGGGIVPRQLAAQGIHVDVVERSPEVLDLAARHFGLRGGDHVSIRLADARDFVRDACAPYDAAIVDVAVTNELSPLLVDAWFWADLTRVLRERSAVAVNLMGALDGSIAAGALAYQAMSRSMGTTLLLPMIDPEERRRGVDPRALRNFVAVAARGDLLDALEPRRAQTVPPYLERLSAMLAEVDARLQDLAQTRDHLGAAADAELRVEPAQAVPHGAR